MWKNAMDFQQDLHELGALMNDADHSFKQQFEKHFFSYTCVLQQVSDTVFLKLQGQETDISVTLLYFFEERELAVHLKKQHRKPFPDASLPALETRYTDKPPSSGDEDLSFILFHILEWLASKQKDVFIQYHCSQEIDFSRTSFLGHKINESIYLGTGEKSKHMVSLLQEMAVCQQSIQGRTKLVVPSGHLFESADLVAVPSFYPEPGVFVYYREKAQGSNPFMDAQMKKFCLFSCQTKKDVENLQVWLTELEQTQARYLQLARETIDALAIPFSIEYASSSDMLIMEGTDQYPFSISVRYRLQDLQWGWVLKSVKLQRICQTEADVRKGIEQGLTDYKQNCQFSQDIRQFAADHPVITGTVSAHSLAFTVYHTLVHYGYQYRYRMKNNELVLDIQITNQTTGTPHHFAEFEQAKAHVTQELTELYHQKRLTHLFEPAGKRETL